MKSKIVIILLLLLSFGFADDDKDDSDKAQYIYAKCEFCGGYIFYHLINTDGTMTAYYETDDDGNKYHCWCFKLKDMVADTTKSTKSTREIFDAYYNRKK